MHAYTIEFVEQAIADIKRLRATVRARIVEEIEKQLSYEPTVETRRRKRLEGLEPPWKHTPPVWQLRVSDWRVFYDVDDRVKTVIVRAVRKKRQKQTEEIL
ncbi:MAG TPA: type II toxin-antitoxin system mRNA interferase toxin, RelE/StbE family [Thermoanaerobaculia bacterium]